MPLDAAHLHLIRPMELEVALPKAIDKIPAPLSPAEQQRLYTIHGKENILDDPYYNPNLTRDREDFSESGDLRRLKEGRVTVRFRGGTLQ